MLGRDEIEQALCAIWQKYLAVEVHPTDDFFDLGGYSLLVVNIVADAHRQKIKIMPVHMFRDKTPARITRALLDEESSGTRDETPISGHDLAVFWLTAPGPRADSGDAREIVTDTRPAVDVNPLDY